MEKRRPSFLIVATGGTEVALMVPRIGRGEPHVAQPRCPIPCPCGVIHRGCDPAGATIFVGPPDPHMHADPDALAVAIVPPGFDSCRLPVPRIVATEHRDFGPWAAAVLRNISAFIFEAGPIGISLTFARRSFESGSHFGAAWVRGPDICTEMAERLLQRAGADRSVYWQVAMRGSSQLTLQALNDVAAFFNEQLPFAHISLQALVDPSVTEGEMSAIYSLPGVE